jgi:hypothetical protein
MARTLNDLIAAAVTGGEEAEFDSDNTVQVQQEDPAQDVYTGDFDDVEKIASALEFLGRRGVGVLLEKTAMCKVCGGKRHKKGKACPGCGMKKKAMAPENNMGQMHREHVQSQVGHNSQSSPMKVPGYGLMPNNGGKRPGMPSPRDGVDTSGKGMGSHHPALSSNEAAINYDKREKSKKVAPALSAVLDNKPYADGKLKENLSGAAGKGDKNINKTAHDLTAVKAELERRRAF